MEDSAALPKAFRRSIDEFRRYVQLERGLALNSVQSYVSDLNRYAEYLSSEGLTSFKDVQSSHISDFLAMLAELGLGSSSRARYSSSIKGIHKYLSAVLNIGANPAELIELPRTGRPLPEALTIEEVDRMLQQPELEKPAGIRDRSILETLYACGLRVTELRGIRQRDILWDAEVIRVFGKGSKERVVPVGKSALEWITRYQTEVRHNFVSKKPTDDILYLNQRGGPLSRMSIWNIRPFRRYFRTSRQRRPSAHIATFLCHSPHRRRRRPPCRSRDARTRRYFYYTDLHHLDRAYISSVHRTYHPRS